MDRVRSIELTLDAPLLLKGWRNLIGAVEEVYQQDYGVVISIEKMDIKPVIPLDAIDDLYILYMILQLRTAIRNSLNFGG